jgi:MarR family 2-MHQ and catechol resistance regulon transcriptional repressor
LSTHYNGTTEERSALDAFIKLMRAAASVEARVNRHLQSVPLTTGQFGVLEALYHLGPMHQTRLCEKVLTSGGNMTLVLDNLGKRGLVERQPDTEDRRRTTVYLTDEGRSLIESILPGHVRGVVAEFGVLSSEEQATLGDLCRKVGLGIGGRGTESADR